MRTIEALGITEEVFKKMYDEYSGFNNTFNRDHPSYGEGEEFLTFLNAGSRKQGRRFISINSQNAKSYMKN